MPDFERLFSILEGQNRYGALFNEEQRRALNRARQNGGVAGFLVDNEDIRQGVAVALDDPAIRERLGEARDALVQIVGPVQRNFGPGVERRWGLTGIDPSEKVDPALEQWMEADFSEEAVRTATAERYAKGYDRIISEELSRANKTRADMWHTYPGRHWRTIKDLNNPNNLANLIKHYGAKPVVLLVGTGLMPVPPEILDKISSEPTSPQSVEFALILPPKGVLEVVDISEEPLKAAKTTPLRIIIPHTGAESEKAVYLYNLREQREREDLFSPGQILYRVLTYHNWVARKIKTRRIDVATESYGPEKVDMIVCTHTAGFLQPDFWKNVHLIKMLGTIRVGGHLVITHFDNGLDPEMVEDFGYREVHRDPLHGRQSVFIYEHIHETDFAKQWHDRIEKAQREARAGVITGLIRKIHHSSEPIADDEVDRLFGLMVDAPKAPSNDVRARYPGELTVSAETPYDILRIMLNSLNPGPDDILYDLGCGRGRVVLYSALVSKVQVRGIELVAERMVEAEEAKQRFGLHNARFVEWNVLDVDFSDGTIFYLYYPFSQETLLKVFEKLRVIATRRPIRIAALWIEGENFFESQTGWLKPLHPEVEAGMGGLRLMMFESTIHPPQDEANRASHARFADSSLDGGGESAEDGEIGPAMEGSVENVSDEMIESAEPDPEMSGAGLMAGMGVTGLAARTLPETAFSPALPALRGVRR